MPTPRVLFILKYRNSGPYGTWNYSAADKPLTSGLSVSASQMTAALDVLRIENKLVQVPDNNSIDREVSLFNPTHVIIEAFWVVPAKFDVLRKLHPTVTWIIRNHSKLDFLAHEGGMIGWALDYIARGVVLACNSPEATADFKALAVAGGIDPANVVYLPNYYTTHTSPTTSKILRAEVRALRRLKLYPTHHVQGPLKIGCFGAIRPLKNTLQQAVAAIQAADVLGIALQFYINGTRIEGKAEPILNSVRQLFNRFPQHTLVELPWSDHGDFVTIVQSMDLVMQVSNSETFNIVSADAVAGGVPVLVSDEIPWLDDEFHANPNSISDIADKIVYTLRHNDKLFRDEQLSQLEHYARHTCVIWDAFMRS